MSHRALSAEQFAHHDEQMHHAQGCKGACGASSDDMMWRSLDEHYEKGGPRPERWEFQGLKKGPEARGWSGATGHHAVVVGEHVVDWTARQFHPDADFPHIEPLKSYKKRWKSAKRGSDWADWDESGYKYPHPSHEYIDPNHPSGEPGRR